MCKDAVAYPVVPVCLGMTEAADHRETLGPEVLQEPGEEPVLQAPQVPPERQERLELRVSTERMVLTVQVAIPAETAFLGPQEHL